MSPWQQLDAVAWDERAAFGCWSHIPGSFAMEVLLAAGFDWCCIDRQHGMIDESALLGMLQMANYAGTPAFVRTSGQDAGEIGRALDYGCDGVIVPMVHSGAEARRVAAACRFPPDGERSWGPTRRKLREALATSDEQNRSTTCFVMVESEAGLNAVDEILSAPGVDGVFLGPADMKIALGSKQHVLDAARRVVSACQEHGKVAGVFGGGIDETIFWVRLGFRFVAVDSDSSLLARASRESISNVRSGLNGSIALRNGEEQHDQV